jgi:hypothetical protein
MPERRIQNLPRYIEDGRDQRKATFGHDKDIGRHDSAPNSVHVGLIIQQNCVVAITKDLKAFR